MASATGIPESSDHPREDQPLLGGPGDVTQQEGRGLQYNLFLGTGMIAQAGIWILTALVWTSVFSTNVTFFSYHPLLMSAGVLLSTQAILLLQPTTTAKQKTQGTHVHFALNLASVIALIAGLIVIEMNKASHPETRFQHPHGVLGLTAFILIIIQGLVGFAQFYVPKSVLGSVENGKKLYKYHRASGYLILLLLLITVSDATDTGFNKNVLHMRPWTVIVASVLVVIGVVPRVRKHKLGL